MMPQTIRLTPKNSKETSTHFRGVRGKGITAGVALRVTVPRGKIDPGYRFPRCGMPRPGTSAAANSDGSSCMLRGRLVGRHVRSPRKSSLAPRGLSGRLAQLRSCARPDATVIGQPRGLSLLFRPRVEFPRTSKASAMTHECLKIHARPPKQNQRVIVAKGAETEHLSACRFDSIRSQATSQTTSSAEGTFSGSDAGASFPGCPAYVGHSWYTRAYDVPARSVSGVLIAPQPRELEEHKQHRLGEGLLFREHASSSRDRDVPGHRP